MEVLKSAEHLQRMLQKETILILQFGSESCAPCHALRCKLDAFCQNHKKVTGRYVPIEEFKKLAAQESVFTVPTILVYVQGRLALQESGFFSLESLLQRIERYIDLLEE